jgi:hypothetical protein
MAVIVASADGDVGDLRTGQLEQGFEIGVGGPVVAHLEDLDLRRTEWHGDVALGVSSEQRVDLAVGG